MSIGDISAAQAAMLKILSQNSAGSESDTGSVFAEILSSKLQEGLLGNGESAFGLGDDLKSLLLLSLLGGSGLDMMMTSLGSAMSGQSSADGYPVTGSFGASAYNTTAKAYGTKDLSDLITPVRASKPVTPAITSNPSNRSAALYTSVIAQFSVETNPRYAVNKKGHGDTYCNIFMWDVTSAMGAEIPHYIDPNTGAPMTYPDVKGGRELSANGIYNWLFNHGSQYGWYQVSAEEAQALANRGQPVVTALKNNSGHGHVQVVCPSEDGTYDPARGVTIAQAGRRLTSYKPITSIYNASLPKVVYFAHK